MDLVETQKKGFFVLPFGIDGTSLGVGFWEPSKLSNEWIQVCVEHLKQNGPAFDAPWQGQLSHISTKLTSASGVALLTFVVWGRVVLSVLLLSGLSAAVEEDAVEMFVESLKKTYVVQATRPSKPFADVGSVSQRPLMVVVPWPDETVSQEDHELVRQLAVHFAQGFFIWEAQKGGS